MFEIGNLVVEVLKIGYCTGASLQLEVNNQEVFDNFEANLAVT